MKNNSLPFNNACVKASLFRPVILIFFFACMASASFGQDLLEYSLFGGKPLNADQKYYSNLTTLSCYGASDAAITIIYPTFEPSEETVALYATTLWFRHAADAENYVVFFYENSTTVGFPTDSVIGTGDSLTGLSAGHYWAVLIDTNWNQVYRGDWVVQGPDFWRINGNSGTSDSSDFIGTCSNNDLVFKTDSIERMRILKTGGIGIGSDSVPSGFKLAVNGKILCEEVKIMPHGNWPDFVFDKDYNLMSLDDLDMFVKEQKHFPNMPCAKTVSKDGVNVGDTQEKLLEQQEQLLLYLLQQNKKLEQQNEKIEQLEKKVSDLSANK